MKDYDERIKELPLYLGWETPEGYNLILDEGEINYTGLNDSEKLCLYVYSWNKSGNVASKKRLLKKFGWTNYYLQKLIKESNGAITVEAAFNESTGMLAGKGYMYNDKTKNHE